MESISHHEASHDQIRNIAVCLPPDMEALRYPAMKRLPTTMVSSDQPRRSGTVALLRVIRDRQSSECAEAKQT